MACPERAKRAEWGLGCVVLLALLAAACSRERGPADVPAVDLLRKLQDAERRPAGGRFDAAEHTFGGRSMASLVVPAESRMTWTLAIPHRAHARLFAAVPGERGPAVVAVRIGISDDRLYTTLVETTVTSEETRTRGWTLIQADLSPYAGRKFSLFYRPDSRLWKVIVGTHVLEGDPAVMYLGNPALMTDVEGAREYLARTTRAR